MDTIISNPINPVVSTNTLVFGDNVQDLLNAGALNVNPTGIIVVNSIADVPGQTCVTTLRDAINQANADPGEDLIVFDRCLFSTAQTITLNLGELDITHNLDIIAPRDTLTGANLVEVSGNKASRVFEIEKEATVTLSGLIISDGSVTNDNGGGIKNSGTLTLDSSIVRNNSASSGSNLFSGTGNGGGIYNSGTVNNGTISGNSAAGFGGGGIYNNNGATVNNSTISGNSTAGGLGGGGIYNQGTVNNSTISGNSATQSGGGIYNNNGGTVNNSTISGNSARSGGGISGGTINNSTISGNSADSGGGISGGTINNSTISGNSADFGGGISIGSRTDTVTVNNSTISGNSATQSGGGINAVNQGGGGYTVRNSIISDNWAGGNGGGIFGIGSASNSTISDNWAGGNGGGIFGIGSASNSTISGNWAAGNGGGICFDYPSIVAGGILFVILNNSTVSGNSAGNDGGGIYRNLGSQQVINSTISGNWAGGNGGGIVNIATVINSTISGNWAGGNGGGIYTDKDLFRNLLLFSTVTQNIAANGGGVYQEDVLPSVPPRRSLRNTIIASNLKSDGGVNPDVSGTFTSNGYNLIGDGTGSTGFGEATWDIVGTSDWPIDPRLAPLDFYGGPTQTIALLPDSPAIGAADPIVGVGSGNPILLDRDPTTDQRGLPRRAADGSADIGAFELS